MDELDRKKRILLKNKSHILRMPNNKKKVEMLSAYFSLLSYYQDIDDKEINEDLDIEDEFTTIFDRCVYNNTVKMFNEIEKNSSKLYEKCEEIVNEYKANEFCEYEYIGPIKVNKHQMEKAIWDFFATLGDDVLKIYYDMILNNNIFLNDRSMGRLGWSTNSTPIDNACITIKNTPYYLDFYITLAHEIGHCYQFYLQKNQRIYTKLDPYCEITSMLFQKLFIEYLKNNNIINIPSQIYLDDHISFLNNVCMSKYVFKLFKDDKFKVIDQFSLSYIAKAGDREIQEEVQDDCGYIEPFNLEPEISEIFYLFGSIISMNFIEKMQNDFDTGWNEFKNFICTVRYLPTEEVIEDYFDINLVKDKIKKLTKSYRER